MTCFVDEIDCFVGIGRFVEIHDSVGTDYGFYLQILDYFDHNPSDCFDCCLSEGYLIQAF